MGKNQSSKSCRQSTHKIFIGAYIRFLGTYKLFVLVGQQEVSGYYTKAYDKTRVASDIYQQVRFNGI